MRTKKIDIKRTLRLLISDLRKNAIPLLIVIAIWYLSHLLFDHFCPLILLTGFPCPGCGLTRAFYAFAALHPLEAMKYNPSYPLWMVLIIAALVQRYIRFGSLKGFIRPLIAVSLITIVLYIYRMIFAFPGHEPMAYTGKNYLATIWPDYGRLVEDLIGKK